MNGKADSIPVNRVFSVEALQKCRRCVESITADEKILGYIVSIINATRPDESSSHHGDIQHYISFGASPRAGIALLKCAKVMALFSGRSYVLPEDVQDVAKQVLRHRLVLNYEAAADSITPDDLIEKIINLMPVP